MAQDDERWMRVAFAQAERAWAGGDWPFGAAVVRDGVLVAGSPSTEVAEHTVTGHAEMNALRGAGARLRSRHLRGCTLYSSHEPCCMCTAAALHAGVARIVVGSRREDRPDLFRPRSITFLELVAEALEAPAVTLDCLREEAAALLDRVVLPAALAA